MADHLMELALVEFTGLLLEDFEVNLVLERLCGHATGVVPALWGAGVAVHGPDRIRVLATVGENVLELEDLQERLGEGPCCDAVASGETVSVAFSGLGEDRWPAYAPEAFRLGVRTAVAVPLQARNRTLGALDGYAGSLDPLPAEDVAALRVLADAAAVCLVAAWERQGRLAAEEQLRFHALHDPLTGLPNRVLFADRLGHAVTGLNRRPDTVGVLFVDLDRFKQVNDVHGHSTGDRLLAAVARRIERGLRRSDSLSRFGGDEFLVLCENLKAGQSDLEVVAGRIVAALDEPFSLPDEEFVVRCSIGAVLAVEGDSQDSILRDADVAMYVAKRQGGGVVVSDRRPDRSMAEAARSEVELRGAVGRGEIEVFYQPVVALADGTVTGFEALARWDHPRRGLLQAAQFLPLVEMGGLMVPVGALVFRQVCARFNGSDGVDLAGRYIAVNFSGRELREPGVVERVRRDVDASGVDPHQIILEVTESSLIREGEGLEELWALSGLGFRVAIDDFGTGYSTLAYLSRLPVQVIKLDRLFVERIGSSRRDDELVISIIEMAHRMSLVVVAEGVESPDQHGFLVDARCDFGQGYLYGPPRAELDTHMRLI